MVGLAALAPSTASAGFDVIQNSDFQKFGINPTKIEINDVDGFAFFYGISGQVTYDSNGTTATLPYEAEVDIFGSVRSLELVTPGPLRSGAATNVSTNPHVVGYLDNGFFTPYHAFRYDIATSTFLDLGTLDPPNNTTRSSTARGANNGAAVVVGFSGTAPANLEHAFRWTASGGMIDLGAGSGEDAESRAYAVSGDGTKIVGTRRFRPDEFSPFETKAFLCTYAAGACPMLDLTDGVATVITAEGAVVAGKGQNTAFRWTNGGGAQNIGVLPGHTSSSALGVSDNGKIVVGVSSLNPVDFGGVGGDVAYDETNSLAFRWTAATGMKSLKQLLTDAGDDLTGITLVAITGISPDGQWMVGAAKTPDTGTNETVPFIAQYCDAAIEGECFRNLDALVGGDLDANPRDDLVYVAGSSGVFAFLNGASWTKLHPSASQGVALGDFNGNARDDLLVDFGVGGLWARYDNGAWTKTHTISPLEIATARLDSNANEEAVVDFGAGGLWARFNYSTWTKLHPGLPQGLAAGDLDGNGVEDLLVDFGVGGLYGRYNAGTWLKLHPTSPDDALTARLDNNTKREAIVDFGVGGLWARFNNTTWTKLHVGNAIDLAAGDLNGNGLDDLLVNFGATGLWARYDNGTWVQLHPTSPLAIAVADLDNSGRADAVADFGPNNLWARFNNASWTKLPALPP